ncbi:hypothetical protein M8J77_019725 [Diaphorina citri]|nr:hypothetical protein M8J77_019725 [Diaphorina citri]
MIFTARQLIEKSIEQQTPLCIGFVDISKAFDSVDSSMLIKILEALKCPKNLLGIIKSLHDQTESSVQIENDKSPAFQIKTGVRQGCVIAPLLFITYMQIIMQNVAEKQIGGIELNYRNDSNMINRRNLKAATKIKHLHILDLMFADDCALVAETPELLQDILNIFVFEAQKLGLRVNEEKTEVMFISTPEENISINGKVIKTVQNFKYLGTVIQSNGQIDKDIQHRLNSASINFRNLYDRVWKPHELSLKTLLQIYETVVLSTLLYSSECWTTTTNHMNVLNAFHLRCLRTICRIKWTDRTLNEEVLKKTGMLSINNIIQKRRLRWAGHISRMDEGRTPHQVAFSELKKGKRQQQKPKKRWIDALKQDFKELQIDTANWRHIAANRDQWRKCINKKVETAQSQQLEKIEYDRRERHVTRDQYSWKCPICNLTKESESGRQYIYKHIAEVHEQNSTPEPNTGTNPNLKCPSCNLECKGKAGLLSHLRNEHNNTGPESVKPIKLLTRTNTPAGSIVAATPAVTTGTSPTTTQPLVTPVNELQCIACSRICKSKAGLRSHQRNVIIMYENTGHNGNIGYDGLLKSRMCVVVYYRFKWEKVVYKISQERLVVKR